MIVWILIIYITGTQTSHGGPITIEFKSSAYCENALEKIKLKLSPRLFDAGFCVEVRK